jgi:predicted Zn-dependent peptidase
VEQINYTELKETLYHETLPNGLHVYLLPKPNFNKTYAVFATRYGSIDNMFRPLGSSKMIKVPSGIAHFLEHKMFEDEGGRNIFNEFAKMGADANAYTSYNMTAYLFSTTNGINQPLNLLLDYVQEPYFTEENVLKEQGIIEQELLMYLDDPNDRLSLGLMKNMFHKNEIKTDVGGTVRSIKRITNELLYTCYETFYHPSNMVLFVIGNFDINETLNTIKTNQASKTFPIASPIKRKYHTEDNKVRKTYGEIHMSIASPRVALGVKFPAFQLSAEDIVKKELAVSILIDEYFGKSSRNYEEMLEQKLINSSFKIATVLENNYGYFVAKTETEQVDAFIAYVKEKLLNLKHMKLAQEDFIRHKKVVIGDFVRRLNSVEFIANTYIDYYMRDFDLLKVLGILESLTLQDVLDTRVLFEEAAMSTFVIKPKKLLKRSNK